MARRDTPIRNYRQAKALLDLRRRQGRDYARLGHNVYLEPRADGCIAVKYWATDIVTYHPDGKITLCCNGWFTVTTKQNINVFSPFGIWQEKGVWYVNKGHGEGTMKFEDGMILDTPEWANAA